MTPDLLSGISLARRLERAEGLANARFVESRARLEPDSGAYWVEIAGAYAMYDGPRSPLTQTFGLGLFEQPRDSDLEKLEQFFTSRGAPVFHEVSPLAGIAAARLLSGRGYQPVEFTSVLFLPLPARASAVGADGPVQVRIAGADERELWVRTAAGGWCESPELADVLPGLMRVSAAAEGVSAFLAEYEGQAIASGALVIHDRIAVLAGASTIPEWRHRGAQRALLGSRLAHAARAGCDLAMICAEPGSASQRNAERQGFRIAYTRIKWGLPNPSQE